MLPYYSTKDIHIGSIIQQKLSESSMTITEFAQRIHCDRTTVNHIFKRKSINIEQLIRISQALNFDFIHEVYCEPCHTPASSPSVFIAVEVNKNLLSQLHLPDNFVQFIPSHQQGVENTNA